MENDTTHTNDNNKPSESAKAFAKALGIDVDEACNCECEYSEESVAAISEAAVYKCYANILPKVTGLSDQEFEFTRAAVLLGKVCADKPSISMAFVHAAAMYTYLRYAVESAVELLQDTYPDLKDMTALQAATKAVELTLPYDKSGGAKKAYEKLQKTKAMAELLKMLKEAADDAEDGEEEEANEGTPAQEEVTTNGESE